MIKFNDDWLFTLSDSDDYTLTTYQPEGWRTVTLPHDWSIESDFDPDLEGCTAFLPGGIGWYTKTFSTPTTKHEKCYIVFDGVYNNAEFWLNGIKLGDHPYGYAPTYYDLTDLLEPAGNDNRISVRVDHSRYADSRWYTGSGIYRDVLLLVTDKLHIPVWGTFVTTPDVSTDLATVEVRVEVANDHPQAREGQAVTDILDANGTVVATARSAFDLAAGATSTITLQTQVSSPMLWDVDAPNLYTANTYLAVDGQPLETRVTRFGIRRFYFDKDQGFFLNGRSLKVKGVCLHHDAGVVGTAVPKDVWRRRLALLKDGGCNAIRSAHNPASDEFLDLCDELGLLVQNEFYDEWDLPKDKRFNMQDKQVDTITRGHSQHFQTWAETDLKNVMRSSRNHPSIFQWSIGNEIEWTYPGNREATGIFKNTDANDTMDWTLWRTSIPPHSVEQVRAFWVDYPEQTFNIGDTARKLADWTRELDTTRPVTANCILPTSSFETGYTEVLDVVGFSYKPDKYDYFKETYGDYCMMGTENVPQWYEWKAAAEREFIAGVFLWTGVDYMGECREEHWPVKVTPQGPLDVAGFPRGSFYMYQSLWRDDIPVLAMYTQTEARSIFRRDESGRAVEKEPGAWENAPREWQAVNPHWNYEPGEATVVEVYSNCESVELFLNGQTCGTQRLEDQADHIYKWAVPYEAGELKAVGQFGGTSTETVLQTVGQTVGIRLTPDRDRMAANKTDVAHVVAQLIDEQGRNVKYEDAELTFEINGEHTFLGTDCGDTSKLESFKRHQVTTAFGRALLMLQATDTPSSLQITAGASDPRIQPGTAQVEVE
ncbi:glycoside hydrolase family 2 TIM barrel-domain containing protein [Algisphaera agarilytica]|uniref:Beta-galactosidase/beta-glucuronidase n=1 Tax=Algisphaera agarilytica TaxID=1385975 RepID=A0A7X0H7B8_9BACT|nr:glycoside hydrolase family 2 TIM barrel-domain containing protein [Algisphaera agarilytica]MBB6429145.1 beta-galactosidase/beta-glucuronidase [Algisphaera agarilytica]